MNPTLQDKRDAAAKHLDAATKTRNLSVDGKRGMTPEEAKSFATDIEQHDLLLGQIETEETELRNKALDARIARSKEIVTKIPVDAPGMRVMDVEVNRTHRPLVAFRGAEAAKNAYLTGRWLMGLFNPQDYRSIRYAQEHGLEYRVAVEGINSAGGVLVPTVLEQAIIDLREQFGTARRFCRVIPMTSDMVTVPIRTGGLSAYFVAENPSTGITTSDKTWGALNLVAKTIAVEARYSSALNEDAIINVADDIAREAAYALAVKEDSCLWDGDGTSTYGGIVGVRTKIVDGTHNAGVANVATSTHDLFAEYDLTDLNGVMAPLPAYAGGNAKWYVSNQFYHGVMVRLAIAAAGNTVATLQGDLNKAFAGYPVVIDQTLPTNPTTAQNDTAVAFFGDLSQAVVFGDRRGITMMADPYSLSSFLQTKLVFSERFDIVAHSLGTNTVAGPLIALTGSTS
jgi:HK97 family phage major capsid protein